MRGGPPQLGLSLVMPKLVRLCANGPPMAMRRLTLPPTPEAPDQQDGGPSGTAPYHPTIQRHETRQNTRFSTASKNYAPDPRPIHKEEPFVAEVWCTGQTGQIRPAVMNDRF
jgi:hypothetical protein